MIAAAQISKGVERGLYAVGLTLDNSPVGLAGLGGSAITLDSSSRSGALITS